MSSVPMILRPRAFALAILVTCLASVSVLARAADASTPRIGVIDPLGSATFMQGLREGLRRAGYREGENVAIEWRATAETEEELQALVNDLVHSKVNLLVAVGTPATRVALQESTLPVVFTVGDPVGSGFASRLAKPGGHGTGVSSMAPELGKKRIEVIHQLAPKARRIGYLVNLANPLAKRLMTDTEREAQALGIQLETFSASNPRELYDALRRLGRKPPAALLVGPAAFFVAHADAIAQAAHSARIPALYPFREYLAAGGLAVYGVDVKAMGSVMAGYVDKILRGANPGDLAIEQMSKYDLAINLRVAREQGITVPKELLYRADEVIR